MLWDLQIINDRNLQIVAEYHRIGQRGKMPDAPKSRISCRHLPINGKRGRLKAFLCISALDALADYSALAATT